MTPQELAGRAADVLRERGHCKDTLEDYAGRVCAVGALNVAAYERALPRPRDYLHVQTLRRAMSLVEDAVGAEHGIVLWNNDPNRTAEEVIAAFDLAAGRRPLTIEVEEWEPVPA